MMQTDKKTKGKTKTGWQRTKAKRGMSSMELGYYKARAVGVGEFGDVVGIQICASMRRSAEPSAQDKYGHHQACATKSS